MITITVDRVRNRYMVHGIYIPLLVLVLFGLPSSLGGFYLTHFGNEGGTARVTMELPVGLGNNTTANLTLPSWANVTSATFNITSFPLQGNRLEDLSVDVGFGVSGPSVNWHWEASAGLGPEWGIQDQFSDGSNEAPTIVRTFNQSDSSNTVFLPKGAEVSSLSLELASVVNYTETIVNQPNMEDLDFTGTSSVSFTGHDPILDIYGTGGGFPEPSRVLVKAVPTWVPENATILNATLYYTVWIVDQCANEILEIRRIMNETEIFDFYGLTGFGHWSEDESDSLLFPNYDILYSTINLSGVSSYSLLPIYLTDLSKEWLATGDDIGILLQLKDNASFCQLPLNSHDGAVPPSFEITYEPNPGIPKLDIGGDESYEWEGLAELNITASVNISSETTPMLLESLNQYLQANDADFIDDFGNEYVAVPFAMNSSNTSVVIMKNLSITYNWTAQVRYNETGVTLAEELNNLLSTLEPDIHNNVTIPIEVSTNSGGGVVDLFGLNISYDLPVGISHSLLDFPAQMLPSGEVYTVVTEHFDPQGFEINVDEVTLELVTSAIENPIFIYTRSNESFWELDPDNGTILDPTTIISVDEFGARIIWKFQTTFHWGKDHSIGYRLEGKNNSGGTFFYETTDFPTSQETDVEIRNFEVFRDSQVLDDENWIGVNQTIHFVGSLSFVNNTVMVSDEAFDMVVLMNEAEVARDEENENGAFNVILNGTDGQNYWNGVNFTINLTNTISPNAHLTTSISNRSIHLFVDASRPRAFMVSPPPDEDYLPPAAIQPRMIEVNISDPIDTSDNFTLHIWREGVEDLLNNSDGIADEGEYISIPLENVTGGQGNFTFEALVDESGNGLNDWISIYITGNDTLGNSLEGGGQPGLDWDFFSWKTRYESQSIIEDLYFEGIEEGNPVLAGLGTKLVVVIEEANGIEDVKEVRVNLTGNTGGPTLVWNETNGFGSLSNMVWIDGSQSNWKPGLNESLLFSFVFTIDPQQSFPEGHHSIQVEVDEVPPFGNPQTHSSPFNEAWIYEDDLIVDSLILRDTTGLVQGEVLDQHTLAGNDILRVQGRIHLEGDMNWVIPSDSVWVSLLRDNEAVAGGWLNEVGEIDFNYTVPLVTDLGGANFQIKIVNLFGGDTSNGTYSSEGVKIDADHPQVTSFSPFLDYHNLNSASMTYILTDEGGYAGSSTLNWTVWDGTAFIAAGLTEQTATNGDTGDLYFDALIDFTSNGQVQYQLDKVPDYRFQLWIEGFDDGGNQILNGGNSLDPYANLSLHYDLPDLNPTNLSLGSQAVVGESVTVKVPLQNYGGVVESEFVLSLFVDGLEVNNRTLHGFPQSKSEELFLNWTPKRPGFHLLLIVVDPNDSILESDEENNQLIETFDVLQQRNENGPFLPFAGTLLLAFSFPLILLVFFIFLINKQRKRTFATDYGLDSGYLTDTEPRTPSWNTYVQAEYAITFSSDNTYTTEAFREASESASMLPGVYHQDQEEDSGWKKFDLKRRDSPLDLGYQD